jgi:6-pyruvoyltetrahydropterin/6-carboxytetrahydropterin synthase
MSNIRVTKIFTFEMAHALWNHDGLCKNIHGHSYKLYVTVKGQPLNDAHNAKQGMVIDFGKLKEIVNSQIIHVFDHSLVINSQAPTQLLQQVNQMIERYHLVNYQPTCENLLHDFADRIKKHLPPEVQLFSLRLVETETSYAEWFAEDNN